ncbi:MAG: hypothetical protein LBQ78_03875 [Tannerellaceae bacterium]|jgi:hypothetical protein|nr:hypothetical protein [Tannerellaceae bacterium]
MKKNGTTPLERLIADRARLSEECRRQERQLDDALAYMHDHSGRLLLSALSLLLSPVSSSAVWHIAKPVLVTWGMGKAQSLLLRWVKRVISGRR